MTIQKHIDMAMMHYKSGNKEAAIRLLEAGIRSAMSTKAASQYKQALASIK